MTNPFSCENISHASPCSNAGVTHHAHLSLESITSAYTHAPYRRMLCTTTCNLFSKTNLRFLQGAFARLCGVARFLRARFPASFHGRSERGDGAISLGFAYVAHTGHPGNGGGLARVLSCQGHLVLTRRVLRAVNEQRLVDSKFHTMEYQTCTSRYGVTIFGTWLWAN